MRVRRHQRGQEWAHFPPESVLKTWIAPSEDGQCCQDEWLDKRLTRWLVRALREPCKRRWQCTATPTPCSEITLPRAPSVDIAFTRGEMTVRLLLVGRNDRLLVLKFLDFPPSETSPSFSSILFPFGLLLSIYHLLSIASPVDLGCASPLSITFSYTPRTFPIYFPFSLLFFPFAFFTIYLCRATACNTEHSSSTYLHRSCL